MKKNSYRTFSVDTEPEPTLVRKANQKSSNLKLGTRKEQLTRKEHDAINHLVDFLKAYELDKA